MDLKVTTTNRGFGRIEFTDLYDVPCSVQASSLATDDAIWFGANEIGLKHFQYGKGWQDIPTPHEMHDHWSANTRMHLSRDQVAALLPILEHFVRTGELPSAV
ncbi:hypothetical protein FF80_03310 [Devosia sp. LC5]|uniref:hypothetical protein n=1 Tax=Devosia sp. LC5 TaxID=1502724 RepID=UPI0004E3DB00|nr:hypothetical protein [Devosia sp. LC5]KFC62743.1 hypothetical protein FF80_03310 [Devosia sp. LC5]